MKDHARPSRTHKKSAREGAPGRTTPHGGQCNNLRPSIHTRRGAAHATWQHTPGSRTRDLASTISTALSAAAVSSRISGSQMISVGASLPAFSSTMLRPAPVTSALHHEQKSQRFNEFAQF